MHTIEAVFVGFQVFLCGYSLIVYRETQPCLRQGRGKYAAISILMLALYILSTLTDSYVFFLLTKEKDSFGVLYKADSVNFAWWCITSGVCTTMVTVIGDGLLVYRCYIVCKENTTAWLLTTIVYTASIAMTIYVNILYATVGSTDVRSSRMFFAGTFLSVGVNCLVTALISYKLIRLRNQVRKLAPLSDSGISLGVVAILVESAVPLTICGVVTAGIGIQNHPTGVEASVSAVFVSLWYAFNALSPQMIAFRVSLGRSWQHEGPQSSFSNNSGFNLEFSHGPDVERRQSCEESQISVHAAEVGGAGGL